MTQFVSLAPPVTPRKSFAAFALAGLAFAGISFAAASPAEAQRRPSPAALSWYGTYVYSQQVPRGSGDNMIMGSVDYRLTVTNRGCRLDMQGVMTNTHIRCSARINGQNLVVSFLSYTNGRQVNEYGTRLYRPGQALLTLQRSGRGLTTHWQAIRPDDDRVRSGRYFRKIR